MSNLPPGVTEQMIPGNRPEDLAYEAFWEEFTGRLVKAIGGQLALRLAQDQAFREVVDDAIESALSEGVINARAEVELERQEAAEAAEAEGDSWGPPDEQ